MNKMNTNGMVDLSASERQVNGGSATVTGFVIGLIAGALLSELLDRNSNQDYQDGWNDAANGEWNPKN